MNALQSKLDRNGLSLFKLIFWIIAVLFCLFSLGLTLYRNDAKNLNYCILTVLFVSLPPLVGMLLRFRISTPIYVFFIFYAAAPLMGSVYKLYYITSWWDDLLHTAAGVVFAMFGIFLVTFFNKGKKPQLLVCLVFAFCFSLTVSALWEMFEFWTDVLLDTDMQRDTIIDAIHSHDLAQMAGDVESIEGIGEVIINGKPLGLGGYLDIGLIDTMKDMMVEAIGAIIYVVIVAVDRNRHPALSPLSSLKHGKTEEDKDV